MIAVVTRRKVLASVVGGGAAIALAACAPAATPLAPAPGAKAPVKSTWTVALDIQIPNPDLVDSSEGSTGMLGHYYESLTDTVGFDFKLAPRLAERWERKDAVTTRFYLRKGVTYHNGAPFTAADVKFSFEEVYTTPAHAHNRYIRWLDKVNVIDDLTVDITTKTPNNLIFLYEMSQLFIGSKANRAAEKSTELPIGTGPYILEKWEKGVSYTLKANPNYWRGKPTPERLVLRSIPDSTTASAELIAGGVDIVRNVDILQAAQLKSNPELEMLAFKGGFVDINYFSISKAPFTDRRVRQALNYAIDRKKLIDTVMQGYAVPLAGPFSKGFLGFDANLAAYPYDPVKAKSLLAEAGYGSGLKIQWGYTGAAAVYKQLWEATAGQMKAVGVDVELLPYTGSFTNASGSLTAGQAWCAAGSPYNVGLNNSTWGVAADPTAYMSFVLGDRPCQQTPQIMALYQKANGAQTSEERGSALRELAKMWHDEALYLEIQAHDFVVGKRKDGVTYQIAPFGNSNQMQQWWDVASVKPLA